MKIAIIIPTRNRVHLLKGTLNRIYKYVYDKNNINIIICDNHSNDKTKIFCEKFIQGKSQFFYKRSVKWIPKEKFVLEWSTKFIKGDYFFFLFDDDYLLVPKFLAFIKKKKLFEKTKLVSFNRSLVLTDQKKKYSIKIPKFNSEIYKYSAKKHLKYIYDQNKIFTNTPMVTNSIIEKNLYLKLKKKYKKLSLYGHMGDYTLSVMLLNELNYFNYINYPLVLFREWKENTSIQIHHQKTTMLEYKNWIKGFYKHINKCPINAFLWGNCIYTALNGTAKKVKLSLRVSNEGYLRSIYSEINFLKKIDKKKYLKIIKYFNIYIKEKKKSLIKKNFNDKKVLDDYVNKKFYDDLKYKSINGRVLMNFNEKKIFLQQIEKGKIKIGNKIFKLYLNFFKLKLTSIFK